MNFAKFLPIALSLSILTGCGSGFSKLPSAERFSRTFVESSTLVPFGSQGGDYSDSELFCLNGKTGPVTWKGKSDLNIFVAKDFPRDSVSVAFASFWGADKFLKLKYVDSKKLADIVVEFNDSKQFLGGNYGFSTFSPYADNLTKKFVLTAYIGIDPQLKYKDSKLFLATLGHEVGHALGLWVHSLDEHDLMFKHLNGISNVFFESGTGLVSTKIDYINLTPSDPDLESMADIYSKSPVLNLEAKPADFEFSPDEREFFK